MPDTPQFSYFLSTEEDPVTPSHPVWKTLLPLSRRELAGRPEKETGIYITHGDYFNSVRSFLEKSRFEVLTAAVAQHDNRDISADDIEEIRICLEKHGEFYHPARVVLKIIGKRVSFVVNVAASPAGTAVIQREFDILQRLNRDFPRTFIPEVYARGEIPVNGGDRVLRMFLGKWFEGFNEFHISRESAGGTLKLAVWDPVCGTFFLSPDQAEQLYAQAAMILTYYYNIETMEKISLWHHAAGDFVLRLRDETVELRLVTVRRYAEMFADDKNIPLSAERMLESLLIFFVDFSMRMRLDRLDGVGDVVWSDDLAVEGVLKGFFKGLRFKAQDGYIPDAFIDCFRNYLSRCSGTDLFELSQAVANTYDPRMPETAVVKENVKTHAAMLYKAIRKTDISEIRNEAF